MSEPRLIGLNQRLRNVAAQEGVAPQRVRNRFVFQRVEQDLPEPAAYERALMDVFDEREASAPPPELPDPPRDWTKPFAVTAGDIGLDHRSLSDAASLVQTFYRAALGRPQAHE